MKNKVPQHVQTRKLLYSLPLYSGLSTCFKLKWELLGHFHKKNESRRKLTHSRISDYPPTPSSPVNSPACSNSDSDLEAFEDMQDSVNERMIAARRNKSITGEEERFQNFITHNATYKVSCLMIEPSE